MKTGRNEPCPCGSGKKYKKCCAAKVTATPTLNSKSSRLQIKDYLTAAENFYRIGNYNKAVAVCNQMLTIDSKQFDAICLLGRITFKNGDNEKAFKLFSRATEISPKDARMQYMCGRALAEAGQFIRAMQYIERAIKLNPEFSEAYNFLGTLYHVMGRTDEVATLALKAVQLDPDNFSLHSHQLVSSHSSAEFSEDDIFGFHKEWAKQHTKHLPVRLEYSNTIDPDRRIRIGYVSPCFNRKIVGYFIKPVIENHNRDDFEIFCYSNTLNKDDYTDYFKANSNWRDITRKKDAEIVELIVSDKIDILIDLSGHVPNNRLLVFAHKPAPLQISWLDYFYSTGLDTMDYLITDPVSTPEGTEQKFTENILRMPATRLCWSPPEFCPNVKELAANTNRYLTFGSFNRPEKMTGEVVKVWANILNRISNSKLILKNTTFIYDDTKQHFVDLFIKHGVDPDRIEFRGASSYENLLEEYNDIDIALDTFPYNGGATTCDALYMGVPIVSLMGKRMISRQTASILTSVGLVDFIAENKDDYVNIAVNWSRNINKLSALKKDIRRTFLSSPVCDSPMFSLNLESLYRSVWKKWCNSH